MTSTISTKITHLVLAAGLLAALLLPAVARAKPPRSFYGVVPQVQLSAEEIQQMGAGGVGTLRTPMVWAALDPSAVPEDYDWRAFDGLVVAAAENGIRVLPDITSTPAWVSQLDGCDSSCFTNPPRSEVALLAWRSFLRHAVQRYGPDGDLWRQNPGLPERPIRDWQLWNEQNSPQYFTPKPDPAVYARLVSEGSRAIKDVDPGATVILGGMFATPGGANDPTRTRGLTCAPSTSAPGSSASSTASRFTPT